MTLSGLERGVASLFLAFVLAISPLPASALGDIAFADAGAPATTAYVAEEFNVVQDGVTFTCETAVDGTAEIACIVAESGVTKVSVPSSIEHKGQTYKVTSLRFSGGNFCGGRRAAAPSRHARKTQRMEFLQVRQG